MLYNEGQSQIVVVFSRSLLFARKTQAVFPSGGRCFELLERSVLWNVWEVQSSRWSDILSNVILVCPRRAFLCKKQSVSIKRDLNPAFDVCFWHGVAEASTGRCARPFCPSSDGLWLAVLVYPWQRYTEVRFRCYLKPMRQGLQRWCLKIFVLYGSE